MAVKRSALLVVNRDKPTASEAARLAGEVTQRYGTLVATIDAEVGGLVDGVPDSDLIVVLGGDGTLLSQTRRFLGRNRPLLGINLGKLGFLAEFDLDSFARQAPRILGGSASGEDLRTRELCVLAAVVKHADGRETDAGLALNEVVITAGYPYRMVELALRIDGAGGPLVAGDGLIVSTPAGSTAYNVSAGGPILATGTQALVITPIAPHSLAFRPVVIPSTSRIEIIAARVNDSGSHGGTTLVLDGQGQIRLFQGDRVVIRQHERAALFVRNPEANAWATLISKMHWAALPRSSGAGET